MHEDDCLTASRQKVEPLDERPFTHLQIEPVTSSEAFVKLQTEQRET